MNDFSIAIFVTVFSFSFTSICLLFILLWRKKKMCRQIHKSKLFWPLIITSYVIVLIHIIIILIFHKEIVGAGAIFGLFFVFQICLVICSVNVGCFCIYIDGTEVVERRLFKETRIDLAKNTTSFDTDGYFTFTIFDKEGTIIEFHNENYYEQNIKVFINACLKIIKENQIQNSQKC